MDTIFEIRYTDTKCIYPKHDFGGNLNADDYVRLTDGKYYKVHSKTLDILENSWVLIVELMTDNVMNL